jgi:hypothetical protein
LTFFPFRDDQEASQSVSILEVLPKIVKNSQKVAKKSHRTFSPLFEQKWDPPRGRPRLPKIDTRQGSVHDRRRHFDMRKTQKMMKNQ